VNAYGFVALKVTLDAPLARHMKYSRATDVFIQWRDPDTRQVYGLTFTSAEAADGFQQWLAYATNPPASAAATRPATTVSANSSSLASESHYQRPQPRPAPAVKQQASDGPDIIQSHQQSV